MNREYRRKSNELLTPVKPGLGAGDVETVSEEMTTTLFQKSVSRKRLNKIGVVSMGEKVQSRLQRREEAAGRKMRQHEYYDHAAAEAVNTLQQLGNRKLLAVVNRFELILQGNGQELGRLMFCCDPIDQALRFLHAVNVGSGRELDALQRNPELCQDFRRWIQKADRIIAKTRRTRERKRQEKEAARQRRKRFRTV